LRKYRYREKFSEISTLGDEIQQQRLHKNFLNFDINKKDFIKKIVEGMVKDSKVNDLQFLSKKELTSRNDGGTFESDLQVKVAIINN